MVVIFNNFQGRDRMKIKIITFVVGTANGIGDAMKMLDELVNDLKLTEIIDLYDNLYPGELQQNRIPQIARRVIYK
jgi:hypothetical protein